LSISVLHILPSLLLGGAERVTVELAELQRKEGLDAQILSLGTAQDFLVQQVKARRIPLHILSSNLPRLQRYRRTYRLAQQFQSLHIHSPRGLRYLLPVVLFLKHKTLVYTRHGMDPLDSMKWKLIHRIARRSINYVTFVNHQGLDVFHASHRWQKEYLRVITNGVHIPEVVNKQNSNFIRFGSIGRMVRLKGQSILLDAVALLHERLGSGNGKAFKLNFFGAGPVESSLREKAEKLSKGLVEFHGEVQNQDSIYANLDVLVVASESEGLSMVIIEAMARGIPAIATNVGGNPTLVKPDKTGILVEYGDSIVLADAMAAMLNDQALIDRLGIAAKQLISSEFSLMKTHEAYLQCYEGGVK